MDGPKGSEEKKERTIAERACEHYPELVGDIVGGTPPASMRGTMPADGDVPGKTIDIESATIGHAVRMWTHEFDRVEFERRVEESRDDLARRIGESMKLLGHVHFRIYVLNSALDCDCRRRVAFSESFVVFHWNE